MKKYSPIAGVLAAAIALPPNAVARTYTVKKNDTLSQISKKEVKGDRPVYGPGGKLEEVITINPQITDPNLIYPNDVILIEKEAPQMTPSAPIVTEGGKEGPAKIESAPMLPEGEVTPEEQKAEPMKPLKRSPRLVHRVGTNLIFGDQRLQVFHSPIVAEKTTVYSQPSYGVSFDWNARWMSYLSTDVAFEAVRTSFDSTADGSFKGKEDALKGISVGVNSHMSGFRLGLAYEGSQEYLFTFDETNARASAVEAVVVDKVKAKAGYTVYRTKEDKVAVGGFVGHVIGGRGRTVKADGKISYGADVSWNHRLTREVDLKFGLGAERNRYEIDLDATQVTVEYRGTVGVGYSF